MMGGKIEDKRNKINNNKQFYSQRQKRNKLFANLFDDSDFDSNDEISDDVCFFTFFVLCVFVIFAFGFVFSMTPISRAAVLLLFIVAAACGDRLCVIFCTQLFKQFFFLSIKTSFFSVLFWNRSHPFQLFKICLNDFIELCLFFQTMASRNQDKAQRK